MGASYAAQFQLTEGLHRLRGHGGRNWLTYASLLLIAFVTLGVPQVRNLFAFPPLTSGAASAATAALCIRRATDRRLRRKWWMDRASVQSTEDACRTAAASGERCRAVAKQPCLSGR